MTLTIETLSGEIKVLNVDEVHISDRNLGYKLKGDKYQRHMLVSQIADISITKTLNEVAKELVEA